MTKDEWDKYIKVREQFRKITEELISSLPKLKNIQQHFINSRNEKNHYKVETPVVYNTALDDLTINDEVKLILVADNPGQREQKSENRRYLVGPSGKIANKFFQNNPALKIDFYKNVIILNKTPIHSPRTIELRQLCLLETNGKTIAQAIEESQKKMASLLVGFHEAFNCPVWITGYSEMRKNGLFESYTESLKLLYANKSELYKQLYIFRHFSMNQFTIDLKQQSLPGETVLKTLARIGTAYKQRILG
ncbi:MAG: hypothetical protein FWB86_05495 [Treponema sp.]|nr:hypothetical protein [Treponema sp.]MCL2250540.1 hypothetical protein [Treponema sp.]